MKNRKIEPLPIAMCRTPAFAVGTPLEAVWIELKEIIKDASPDFYQQIAHLEYQQLSVQPQKVQFTIWKYFNRSRYRSTPFGTFAAFTVLPIEACLNETIISRPMTVHAFTDWRVEFLSGDDPLTGNEEVIINPTAYVCGSEVRFVNFSAGKFFLSSIELPPELEWLFSKALGRIRVEDLVSRMKATCGWKDSYCQKLLATLIEAQLFQSGRSRNITGTDYFERRDEQLSSSSAYYQLSERKLVKGCFDIALAREVAEFIELMSGYVERFNSTELDNFKKRFIEKFGERIVPLAIAMDPEVGVGYGNLEHTEMNDELVDLISQARSKSVLRETIAYTALHRHLLAQLISKKKDIQLSSLNHMVSTDKSRMPNTLSAMVHLFGGRPVVNYVGGNTANALLGRFTMASEDVNKFCKKVADLESLANPGVCFFDVAYQAEREVDNVNRRKSLYSAELPINSWSDSAAAICTSDILVMVEGDEVVLQHKQRGERMVPRIPSAYNHTRSDLALFRFLCDIQHYGLQVNLTLRLWELFPGLEYYPRVCYKSLIVSPACWRVPDSLIHDSFADMAKRILLLRKWMDDMGLTGLFRAGHADQTLVFDSTNHEDLVWFFEFAKQYGKELLITEALLDSSHYPQDQIGSRYFPEYVLSFGHERQLYDAMSVKPIAHWPATLSEVAMQGSEWLYYEIYTHADACTAVLKHVIAALGSGLKGKLRGWFFIRYTDPRPHLRLRLWLHNPADCVILLQSVSASLAEWLLDGKIEEVLVKPYRRELARYGQQRMEMVEDFFCVDSKIALTTLGKLPQREDLYASILQVFRLAYHYFLTQGGEAMDFTLRMANAFSVEMKLTSQLYKKINANYRHMVSANFSVKPPIGIGKLAPKLSALALTCATAEERHQLLADLLHLHVNRLFASDQRMHEAIVYQYVLQQLRREKSAKPLTSHLEASPESEWRSVS